MKRALMSAVAIAFLLMLPELLAAQDLTSSIVGTWKLTSFARKEVATGKARIISSSRPTVVTKYPRAQNLWPRKFRILRSTFCAIHIELFPFMYPMICATEYLGGIDISIWT